MHRAVSRRNAQAAAEARCWPQDGRHAVRDSRPAASRRRAGVGAFVGQRREGRDLGAGRAPALPAYADRQRRTRRRARAQCAGRAASRLRPSQPVAATSRVPTAAPRRDRHARRRSARPRRSDVSISACSSACTRPRCRFGRLISACRGNAPSTAMPASASARRTRSSCRGLATRLSTTPARRTPARKSRSPAAIAAAVCACPDGSITSTTGQSSIAAISAVAPVPETPRVGDAVEQSHRAFGEHDIGAACRARDESCDRRACSSPSYRC